MLQAFAALGHSSEPKLLEDPVITVIARRVNKTPAQVLLAWAIQRGTALLTTATTPSRIKENSEISALPEEAVQEISDGVKTRVRFNAVVETGVPGFIPRGKERLRQQPDGRRGVKTVDCYLPCPCGEAKRSEKTSMFLGRSSPKSILCATRTERRMREIEHLHEQNRLGGEVARCRSLRTQTNVDPEPDPRWTIRCWPCIVNPESRNRTIRAPFSRIRITDPAPRTGRGRTNT